MQSLLSALSGIVFLGAHIPYIWSIARPNSTARPAIVSWVIWTGLDAITLIGMYQRNTLSGTIVSAVVGASIIVALSLFKGRLEYKPIDLVCCAGALIGLGLWWHFDNPTFGIVISQTLVLIGAVPTWTNAARNPDSEDRVAWTLYFIGALLGVLAIPAYTLDNAAQPWTFFIIETGMIYILYFRARPEKSQSVVT